MFEPEIPHIFSFFTEVSADVESLWPAEKSLIHGFGQDRLIGFTTGRFCARKAMERMGAMPSAVMTAEDRSPIWPTGIAGSISHTRGLTGALICAEKHHPSIGLDIEQREAVDTSLWEILFDDQEQRAIRESVNPRELATLYFSLKEAYYKMQYPLTRRFLDFRDVCIESSPRGLQIKRMVGDPADAPAHFCGHRFAGSFVITWAVAIHHRPSF